ncbi:Calcineurin subunit B type 2 [Gonapodya sp. JEL0774]|nr:Calcineurin subunit B type 2 [Gonapodya sp. JEL0774]
MGNRPSTLLPEEIEEMQNAALADLTEEEINRLYARFCQLDKSRSGAISTEEFFHIPELAMNPLAPRIVSVFDEDGRGEVNFRQFVKNLSIFSPKAKREVKLRFAFEVYDLNGDGFIDPAELYSTMRVMVGSSMTDLQLRQIVDKTLLDADVVDKDGKISFEEFKRSLAFSNVEGRLVAEW